jgi:small conductance mechanosensitive channel
MWLLAAMMAACASLSALPAMALDAAASDGSTAATAAPQEPPRQLAKIDSASAAAEQSGSDNGQARPSEAAGEAKPSNAERIARLNRAIESDRKRLAELRGEIDRPDSDYEQAEEEFERLDAELDEFKKNFEALKQGGTAEEIAAAKKMLDELSRDRQQAEERFELEIEERKALTEQITSLEEKVAQDQAALDKLRGQPVAKRGAEKSKEPERDEADKPKPAGESEAAPAEAAGGDKQGSEPPATTLSINGSDEVATDGGHETMAEEEEEVDEELAAAAEQAKEKEAEAEEAEDEARSIADRIAVLQANVAVARTLRENSLRKVDNTDDTVRSLEAEFRQGVAAGLPLGQLEPLRARLAAAQDRFKEARAESRDRAARLDELQSELTDLQTEQIHALEQAEAKRQEAEAAQQVVADLQNPLALRNVLQWLLDHGPKILTILAAMGIFILFSRMLENRLVELMARRGSRGSVEDRENRAKTLVGVFHNAASMLIICGGLLMIFDEVGIPVGPLMGGAAVLGLAVAFGAQSLIKDFFTGFMILLEQQFMVNDVVKIGDISGQVERITLRMTVLRDLEGRVHFIPHGQIGSTTNLTHGWSRAVFDIGISYSEDADRVMNVLLDIGRGLRRDPEFGPLILEDPVMLGVDALGESAVQIKFYFKTRPLRQWPVKREMLRRIKSTFDELGIEIPYPHRTVVHRYEGSMAQPPHDASRDWHQQVA